jgi:putative glutamine amidotransferase
VIGLTVNWKRNGKPEDAVWGRWRHFLNGNYVEMAAASGCVPVAVVPLPAGSDRVERLVGSLDLLVMTGGGDPDPRLYSRPRDGCRKPELERPLWELELLGAARSSGTPVLGICLGMQMMAIHSGGALIQDLPAGPDGSSIHDGSSRRPLAHPVDLVEGTMLRGLLGSRETVCSFHHQAVDGIPAGFSAAAWSDDGVLEAMESTDGRMVGVQWHPERDGTGVRIVRRMLSAQAPA